MVLANLATTVETPHILLRETIGDGIGVGLETGKVEVTRERAGETQRGIGTSGIEIEAPAETDNTHAEIIRLRQVDIATDLSLDPDLDPDPRHEMFQRCEQGHHHGGRNLTGKRL